MGEEFDINSPSRGVGDSIAKLTHAIGLDKVVEKVADALGIEDCGCGKRQEILNKAFPYKPPDPIDIPDSVDINMYKYEGARSFRFLQQLTISTNGEQAVFTAGSIVEVSNQDMLYNFLKHLLETRKIESYAT